MRTKFRLRVLAVFATAGALVLASSETPALAYTRYGHRLVYGVAGQHYWISSTAAGFEDDIQKAMDNWSNTSSRIGVRTPIYYSETGNRASSRMDLYQSAKSEPWCGKTYHFTGDTAINPSQKDWVWAKIVLTNDLAGAECPNYRGVISHEMGHGMGLDHTSTKSSVMYTSIAGTSVRWAVKDDCNGINAIY